MVSIKYKRIGSLELQELERMSTNRTTMRKATEGTSNRQREHMNREEKSREHESANEAKNQAAALHSDHCRKTATSGCFECLVHFNHI
jgi:hypothetical protein